MSNNNNNLSKLEKNSLKEELNKDNLIKNLTKKIHKYKKLIIFSSIIIIIFLIVFSYIYFLKTQLYILKIQTSKNYLLLTQIESKKDRKKIIDDLTLLVSLNYNPNLSSEAIKLISDKIYEGEKKYGIKSEIWLTLIATESEFNPKAVSRAGAIGLLQIMPNTGRCYAQFVNKVYINKNCLFNIDINLSIGMYYFYECLTTFNYDFLLALLAYNNGITAIKKIPVYKIKKNKNLMKYYLRFFREKNRIERLINSKIELVFP